MPEGTIAGYAFFGEGVEYWLHPEDRITGLKYSLLPMIHAVINGMLSAEETARHLKLIETHLLGVDGARLFDRPMEYRGGLEKYFQRAESSPFFGREIGLMYMHAHLRYAEALARCGDADRFFHALCQANPVGIRRLVPAAALRQSNCYYSSSDAVFGDRYQAHAEYERVKQGTVALEGGWRVYSSGAGIAFSLIMRCFLGFRREKSFLVIDPIMPKALDGMRAQLEIAGYPIEIVYRVGDGGSGPQAVKLNGEALPFERERNPYRTGAARVPMAAFAERLRAEGNAVEVLLGGPSR